MKRLSSLFAGVFAAMGAVSHAQPAMGGLIVVAEEVGGDVVFSGGGTLDLSLWSFLSPGFGSPGVLANESLALGPDPHEVDLYFMPQGFDGPLTIGPGVTFFAADSGAGDPTGLAWTSPSGLAFLAVPTGYVSGGPISGSTAQFIGHTFDSLGLGVGSYTWTWDTASGGSDFFTINVPAPGAITLLCVAGIAMRRRRGD